MNRSRRVSLVLLIAGSAVVASCGPDPSPVVISRSPNAEASGDATNGSPNSPLDSSMSSDSSRDDSSGSLRWEPLDDYPDIELSTLEVPVNYDDPTGPKFELALARHVASDPSKRIGSLLVNPGGPGFGGTGLALDAVGTYDQDILDRFDIVAWDPRGTGDSTPAIDCVDDYDYYIAEVDSTPVDDAANQHIIEVAQDFADQCVAKNASIFDYVGTNNSARDMNSIREALGEDKISYFGFSYGSELGATWATLFPETVRAAVLDGAADPTADAYTGALQQMTGFQASLETFLNQCQEDPRCAFVTNGDARAAYEQLMTQLDEKPIPSDPGRPPVNRDVAISAVITAMYSDTYWQVLESALGDAQKGEGSGLLALFDAYYQRDPRTGTWADTLEAFQVISCDDTTDRPTPEEVYAQNDGLTKVAPLLVPAGTKGGFFCTYFPPPTDPRVTITGAGAGPIVVVGTTGDPATPLNSSRQMARSLEDGRLVIVTADQHTGYGVNECINLIVSNYLINLEPPENNTECS